MAFEIIGDYGVIMGENVEVDGNPTGGHVAGVGFRIDWQDGPLGTGKDRVEPSGACVEDVLRACLERLRFYQGESESEGGSGRFRCEENARMVDNLEEAIGWANQRTAGRKQRGVEGMNSV